MSVRISAKEILAKLMAAENILVEHANVPTAGFDLINRKLLLPNWKNISDDVYTLLISHEVGHALYTPTKEWEDAIMKAKDKSIKQVVNIIEDVRIEKLIQGKYPGTVRAFRSGYDELEKSNLFGTKDRTIDSYGLLDRLNLHFKLGHFGYAKVPFSDDEKVWVDKISACKTFSDVLRVAAELKQYVDENEDNNGESETQESMDFSEMQSDGESSDSQNQSNERIESSMRGNSSESSSSEESDDQKESQSGSGSNGDDQQQNRQEPTRGASSGSQSNPKKTLSETQQHFDSAIQDLIDKSIADTRYANIPDIELDKIVVPYKTVHDQISNYYTTYFSSVYDKAQEQVEKFKNGSKNTVNQLANIFEMKKRAKLDVRALTSKTGKLDTNKVHSYRYNDDIFKKLTVVPQGKSHGLIMFIDMSSSMCENIVGTYEQLLNLVLFCRRVGIPFEVYGFTDASASRGQMPKHPSKVGDLTFDDYFCLRNYFSSKMSGPDFNKALQNIICIMRHYSGQLYAGLPAQETLNTTPLVSAALVGTKLIKKFREDNGLDIVNTIFLTDGEDTHGLSYNDGQDRSRYFNPNRYNSFRSTNEKYYVRDIKTRKQWEIKNTTGDMMNILRETVGVKTICFHIIKKRDASYMISRMRSDYRDEEQKLESFKNHKFCELNNVPGFDAYYLIPSGSSLSVEEGDEFSGNIDTTVDWEDEKQAKKAMKQVTKHFNNFMKQKITSRILLNRFIEHIS